MGLSSLANSGITVKDSWTAQNNITGSDYSPITSSGTITKAVTQGTAAANAAVGGADEKISFIQSIGASASVSIDLTALTDVMQTAGVSLARVKTILIRLLNVADDSVVGTAASSITVDATITNGLTSQSGSGWLTNSTSKFDVPSGGFVAFGTVTAAGVLVDGTHKILKLTNNDGALTAKVQITIDGGST